MSLPTQTAIETSITFIDPKAAMPSARISARPSASSVARRQAGDQGAARKPSRATSAAKARARAASPRQAMVKRRAERLARALITSGSAATACSSSHTQAPQVRPETIRSSSITPPPLSRAWAAKSVVTGSAAPCSAGRSSPAGISRRR